MNSQQKAKRAIHIAEIHGATAERKRIVGALRKIVAQHESTPPAFQILCGDVSALTTAANLIERGEI